MRDAINTALKEAMKAGDKSRLSTLRLMNAAIKDRDIAARGDGKEPLNEEELLQLFQKMVKQRQESAKIYDDNARPEMAAQEREEIAVIQGFMPTQMDEAEMTSAVDAVVTELGAAGMKDMGRVMAALKERYAGTMDFGKANGIVKSRLS
ncbi:GatB/YqeY domain-containing protein [Terrihabitans rhizophilus]|jgi:uncharacterized protein YqeY|uniref:GatB/YqeY domain-containing protein n=1 Tax=Terrihabitans rhizophilus TaxID=3092662 RepID=A0ABU4RN30_9HYPH|nr:GatB/YqeY domain-containing protein [Terrihabitans sp. PJ23]MDX6805608.1 GatB/YqeY domain-containing protein [Terrihabitans sp. PJ23]